MKRLIFFLLIISVVLTGCGGGNVDISVVEAPKYKDGVSYPFVISIEDKDKAVTDLDVVATLEMARMDHGTIEVIFSENEAGIYEGDVELPMAGEWIANIIITEDGKTTEKTIEFEVNEG